MFGVISISIKSARIRWNPHKERERDVWGGGCRLGKVGEGGFLGLRSGIDVWVGFRWWDIWESFIPSLWK